jgi:hypothetical protein
MFRPIYPTDNMSAPCDGNFQDHYVILEVDQQSVSETIQQAYAKLAQKYHSRNSVTGDVEMFEPVNLAHEVLSNPERRGKFDKLHGISQEGAILAHLWRIFAMVMLLGFAGWIYSEDIPKPDLVGAVFCDSLGPGNGGSVFGLLFRGHTDCKLMTANERRFCYSLFYRATRRGHHVV